VAGANGASANCVRHGGQREDDYRHRDEDQHELGDASHEDGRQDPSQRLLRARRCNGNAGLRLPPDGFAPAKDEPVILSSMRLDEAKIEELRRWVKACGALLQRSMPPPVARF
jgi:putative hemolysin